MIQRGTSPWRWPLAAVAGLMTVVAGIALAYFLARGPARDSADVVDLGGLASPSGSATVPGRDDPLPDVTITLTPDVMAMAGILVEPVSTAMVAPRVAFPGIVEPNTIRQVVVPAPASGRVLTVSAETGTLVEPGQVLARLESTDLALAQSQLLAARTVASSTDQELLKMEKLMAIGAVSRQDLERVRTDRALKATDVDAARARLTQLGMSSDQIAALLASGVPATTVEVVAPGGGTVVAQQVAQGQIVDVAAPLFTIADLSSVWIGGDLPEREFARVTIGNPATAAVLDVPDGAFSGSVIFIDPQINATTHTARIRVEIANPLGQLKTGMAAEVDISGAGSVEATLVPREAVQNVNHRQVVYLAPSGSALAAGTFVEHEVHLGAESGNQVAVTGVTAGDHVVVKGSGFLRTERERLGLRR